jgi:hypothetical protein
VLLCPKCAAQLKQGALICSVCRQPVGQAEEARFAETASAEEPVSHSPEDPLDAQPTGMRMITIGNVRSQWSTRGTELGCASGIVCAIFAAAASMTTGEIFFGVFILLVGPFLMGLLAAVAGGCIGVVLEGIVTKVRWFFDPKLREISHFIKGDEED